MKPDLDKDARLFKKAFHVVFRDAGIEFLVPKTYNSKIEDVKRRYQEVDGEHFLFVKSEDGAFAIDPPSGNPGYTISVSLTPGFTADYYFQTYSSMYEDISGSLPETQMPIRALSVTPAPLGTISCQFVIEAPKGGALLITGTGVPRADIDEFTALAEYIKPFEGAIPAESDKEGYKANTYHPEIHPEEEDIEDADAEESTRILYPELDAYDSEDHNKYDKGDDWEIVVDLKDKEQMRRVLNRLIKRFDDIEDGIEFGQKVNGEFEAYRFEDDSVGYGSEIPFFSAAAEFPELHKKILVFVDLAIDSDGAWLNDEVPKGLHAAYALAMHDQKYIPKYIQLLRVVDMDHEVYQSGQIVAIVEKWKDYDNALSLLATRCCSASGQHGRESLSFVVENILPELKTDKQKQEIFVGLLFLDTTKHHYNSTGRYDKLIEYWIGPALDTLEIDYNEQKVEVALQITGPKHLPGLADIS